MDLVFYGLCFADFVLIVTSFIYGLKFLKKRNYLLGLEWWIVTFSAANFFLFALGNLHVAYSISYFCDAFSRGFGIPLIATLGLMGITHHYKPSIAVDIGLFAAAFAGGVALVAADFVIPAKPYFYVVTWSAFSIYLAYFAKRLLSVGEVLHGVGVILALASAQAIACIYDFYKIPGDDEHMIFYTFAALTWSFLCVEMYYAYCALERAEKNELEEGHTIFGLEHHS